VFDPRLSIPEFHAASGSTSSAEGERVMGKKARKPITTKEPPVPTDSHAEIEDWMNRLVMPDMHPIVERLDGSIRETIGGLQYAIKWKNAYYGVPELGWIIEIAAYAVSVNVSFFGANFDLPPPLWNHIFGPDKYVAIGSEPLRQADDPGGGAGTGDAQVDRTSGARAGLEMRVHGPKSRPRLGKVVLQPRPSEKDEADLILKRHS